MNTKEYKRPDTEAMRRVLERNQGFMVECALRLAWTMGFAVSEMIALKWDAVSFETKEIVLPKRRVPMDDEMERCLQTRKKRHAGQACEFIITSDRTHQPMTRISVSRAARLALDAEESLRDITLTDLREDYVIRLLEQHDWPYVAKVSGIRRGTLLSSYAEYAKRKGTPRRGTSIKQVEEVEDYEYKLWVLFQSEGLSPEGLAIWMIWNFGIQLEDVASLTWEQVDFETKIICIGEEHFPMGVMLERRLRQLLESRGVDADSHVLLTPKSRRPFHADRLSKVVGEVLVQNGLGEVDLGKLGNMKEEQRKEDLLMQRAKQTGFLTVVETAELLQTSNGVARRQLKKLEERGLLSLVGVRYYLAEKVVPPEKQEEVITQHIRENGGTRRKDLANLLGIEEKQCTWILDTLVKKGPLVRIGTRYYLREEVAQADEWYGKIRVYLEEKGMATREDLAELLNIKKGSVKGAAKELVASGKLVLVRGNYYLPDQSALADLFRDAICGYLKETKSASRQALLDHLQIEDQLCAAVLRELVQDGTLVYVGYEYYLAGTVEDSEQHYALIQEYLEEHGEAKRQEIAALLHMEDYSCSNVLKGFLREGKLATKGRHYVLSGK